MSKRLFDISITCVMCVVCSLPMIFIFCVLRLTIGRPAFHWSKRVGRDNQIFLMPKFRTMRIDTPNVATHLLSSPEHWITPFGALLRKTSLDELPQLWSVLIGDMSLVGPRPALFNQDDLINLRTEYGVHKASPGITGWAQINGRDDLSIEEKVKLDAEYLDSRSLGLDLWILCLTAFKVLRRSEVSH